MSILSISDSGKFEKTKKFLETAKNINNIRRRFAIESIAESGVNALSKATPVDTGKTASSWSYEITEKNGKITVSWNNSNVNKGVNIAVILQYGHGTKNGGYVRGIDYINPALKPIFNKMADDMWRAVVSL